VKLKLIIMIMLIALLVAACGSANPPQQEEPTPDVAFVRTSAANTVVAQFTLTAAAFTPTTSLPTETPAPQVTNTSTTATQALVQATNAEGTVFALCDSLSIDPTTVDVNIPDGTVMSPGQDFVKTWRVKNSGSCPWGEGYELVYAGYADEMSGQFQPITEVVQPGQEVELSVQFTAPDAIGTYVSAWQMQNPAGVTFEEIIFVKIVVQ